MQAAAARMKPTVRSSRRVEGSRIVFLRAGARNSRSQTCGPEAMTLAPSGFACIRGRSLPLSRTLGNTDLPQKKDGPAGRASGEADNGGALKDGKVQEDPTRVYGNRSGRAIIVDGYGSTPGPCAVEWPGARTARPDRHRGANRDAKRSGSFGIHDGNLQADGRLHETYGCLRVDNHAACAAGGPGSSATSGRASDALQVPDRLTRRNDPIEARRAPEPPGSITFSAARPAGRVPASPVPGARVFATGQTRLRGGDGGEMGILLVGR